MFALKIDTTTSAFDPELYGDNAPQIEVARLLRLMADHIEAGDCEYGATTERFCGLTKIIVEWGT